MGAQKFGTATIYVDGAVQSIFPGASIDIGGVKRTEVVSDQPSDVGFYQQNVASEVTCEAIQDGSTSLAAMANWSDVTIQFSCDTGQNYIVNHAFLTDPPKTTAGQGGKIPLK